ncbi:phosphatidylglycerol lysyltransferase domain-containing protein [Pseudoalteromonas arctica]|uniref:DUF2156 domain-containing protein n=1 Tax=Pseudoalteromonas arctica TaxID=394751 RepID=A0A7Y0HCF3_9GAMM|nr:phosphatidylglycerol lysyltransferase domain-containing protein [Pseudoalteromonas arctica]NMM39984.1 DUF2156 domain-containing protein [Pseudoalteromonas arctica]
MYTITEICNQAEFNHHQLALEEIDKQWLNKKNAKALDFMVTDRNKVNIDDGEHRIFIASLDDVPLAYILFSRSYGEEAGWFHNLSRHLKSAPMGTMQAINDVAIERFQHQGEQYLHFGLTPMADLNITSEIQGYYSKTFCWLVHFLQKHGDKVYPSRGQRQYKMSWRPQQIIPDFIAFEGGFSLRALLAFLKITNSL